MDVDYKDTMNDAKNNFDIEIENVLSSEELEVIRIKYAGKKGIINDIRSKVDMSKMSGEERKEFGVTFNELKNDIEKRLETDKKRFITIEKKRKAKNLYNNNELPDFTLPGTHSCIGSLHPITLIQMELEEIFHGMGFTVMAGFEVEEEQYNFDALNIPTDHPAREMQDTYWLTNGKLMRTHTSANQVRALEQYGAPLRAIFPGRCFRYESVDASHDNTFFQAEGLMVDKGISIANLIAVMKCLLSQIFGRDDVTVRLRPGFFPFVEPGFELDVQCLICGGSGCQTCKKSGWIELIPCGMVHPKVLEAGGIDTSEYSGFAFGVGLSRLAMMRFGIPEIRLFNSGDIRFLEQFRAAV